MTPWSSRQEQSRVPGFPIGITTRTINTLADTLQRLQYSGPIALACDDTRLSPALRPYYNVERDEYILLGAMGILMVLPELDKLAQIIQQGHIKKATQARFFNILLYTSPIINCLACSFVCGRPLWRALGF